MLCAVACAALCLTDNSCAEDSESPFVCRTFGFFVTGEDVHPDYFLSDESIAVVTGPEDAVFSDFHFAPCPIVNGPLADTTWVTRTTRHVRTGNHLEGGTYVWLLNDENPEPPPEGVMTLTGDGSPLILSQDVVNVRQWNSYADCPTGRPGDLVAGSFGRTFVIVTALFNR